MRKEYKCIYWALIYGAAKKTITIGDTFKCGKEQICFLCHINIPEGQLSAHFLKQKSFFETSVMVWCYKQWQLCKWYKMNKNNETVSIVLALILKNESFATLNSKNIKINEGLYIFKHLQNYL